MVPVRPLEELLHCIAARPIGLGLRGVRRNGEYWSVCAGRRQPSVELEDSTTVRPRRVACSPVVSFYRCRPLRHLYDRARRTVEVLVSAGRSVGTHQLSYIGVCEMAW